MQLALRLGKTLGELRQSIGISELRMWMAFDRISPIGDDRNDYHAAQIAAAVFNVQRTKDPLSIGDMLIRWNAQEDEEEEDTAGLEAFLENLVS
ncbi:MAG: phage tail assembly protein T [Serratia sp. (in: enterobacteria)]|uniref:phage tail assembly protein T n=1 Tax=Serratia sp. (in: enterobacteria) TaxID=616 RepID=UPI003F34C081